MKDTLIKRTPTLFLKAMIMLIGIGTLVFLLWEPHIEGRNAHATLFEIYFQDPFLAYVYITSILFFMALYQAFSLLGYIEQNTICSRDSVRAIRTIKYCALALVASIVATEFYLFIFQRGKDDIAGGVAMGLLAMLIFLVITATATVLERLLQRAVDMKSKNLTV